LLTSKPLSSVPCRSGRPMSPVPGRAGRPMSAMPLLTRQAAERTDRQKEQDAERRALEEDLKESQDREGFLLFLDNPQPLVSTFLMALPHYCRWSPFSLSN